MKRNVIIFSAVGIVIVLGGILFWFYIRSQAEPIQYQNSESITAEQTTPDTAVVEAVETENVSVETTEPKNNTAVEATATDAIVPKQEATVAKALDSKDSQGSNDSKPKNFAIKSKLVSFGFESSSDRNINTVVLHSSHGVDGDPYSVDDVIALWKSYGVAPHYMIARDGTVYQLVADKNIAYHAGDSKMPDGRTGVNNFSIGVEILNTKTDSYTSAQYQATKDLVSYLKGKYGKMTVVGHDDIAPGRKTDPWNFDWDKI